MPRDKPPYSDFFDEALTRDVEELLSRFQEAGSVRYADFSLAWRRMRFSDVFLGVPRPGELRRFCGVALATAVKYFLPPFSFQIRVGGLYLMFALYHAQPAVPPLNLRLALKDRAAVERFLRDAAGAGHEDVLYVHEKLVAARAFRYAAMPHPLHFQKQKKPRRDPVAAPFLGRASGAREFLSPDLLEELGHVQALYAALKAATAGVGPRVGVAQPDLVPSLEASVGEFAGWQRDAFAPRGEEGERGRRAEEDRASLLRSIKQKSYRNLQEAPRSRRHRQGRAEDGSGSSGPEQAPEGSGRWQRPPSLRARTWKSLGVPEKETTQVWLLSAPEEFEGKKKKRGAARRQRT